MHSLRAHELRKVTQARAVVNDGEIARGAHDLRAALALVAELGRGQPGVLPERDPHRVDPAVLADRVADPLRDHDGDHDGQHVRERAGQLEIGCVSRQRRVEVEARARTSNNITTSETGSLSDGCA